MNTDPQHRFLQNAFKIYFWVRDAYICIEKLAAIFCILLNFAQSFATPSDSLRKFAKFRNHLTREEKEARNFNYDIYQLRIEILPKKSNFYRFTKFPSLQNVTYILRYVPNHVTTTLRKGAAKKKRRALMRRRMRVAKRRRRKNETPPSRRPG